MFERVARRWVGVVGAVLLWALSAEAGVLPLEIKDWVRDRYGAAGVVRVERWEALVWDHAYQSTLDKLRAVNDFFNGLTFETDQVHWQQEDYWATPFETLGSNGGDCEDFAIAKYYTLRMVGVESAKLRLIYVRARTGVADGTPTQAHMVLAFYGQADAEPLVLDNLIGDIRPASRRPDLSPVFSFNSEGVFVGATGKDSTVAAGLGRLSRWEDLLRRARAEGFE